MQIKDLVDHRGYTLLHIACFKNLDEIVGVLIKFALNVLSKE